MRKFDRLVVIVMVLSLIALFLLGGCGVVRAIFGLPHHGAKDDILPPAYDWTLVWIIGGSIIGIGIGVTLAIILPGDDHVPYGIIGGCSAALVLCLVIGTIKAIITWALVGGCVLGVLWLVYKLYGRARIERLIKETT